MVQAMNVIKDILVVQSTVKLDDIFIMCMNMENVRLVVEQKLVTL